MQKLLFFVTGDADGEIVERVHKFVDSMNADREWLCGPLHFIHQQEALQARSGDKPIVTIGGRLEIYTALAPWSLPRDVDRGLLEEVEFLVQELCTFSRQHGAAFRTGWDRPRSSAHRTWNGRYRDCAQRQHIDQEADHTVFRRFELLEYFTQQPLINQDGPGVIGAGQLKFDGLIQLWLWLFIIARTFVLPVEEPAL